MVAVIIVENKYNNNACIWQLFLFSLAEIQHVSYHCLFS